MVPVEATETNPMQWNSTRNCPVLQRVSFALSDRCHRRLLREAAVHMADYGLDWGRYGAPAVYVSDIHPDFCIGQVEWRHKTADFGVHLSEIWFDRKTGRISQCGTQHGDLVA